MRESHAMELINVCGHNRSGTTLVQRLLDGHPELAVSPVEDGLLLEGARPDRIPRVRLWRFLTREVRLLRTDRQDWRDYGVEPDLPAIRRRLLLSRSRWLGGDRERLRAVFEAVFQLDPEKPLVIKMPKSEGSFRFLFDMDPDARMIYCARAPEQVFLSQQRNRLKKSEVRPADVEAHVALACGFVAYYRRSLQHYHDATASFPGKVALVRYERLMGDTEAEMRRIAEFLGISWSETLVNPTHAGSDWAGNAQSGERGHGIFEPQRSEAGVPREALELVASELEGDFAVAVG